MCSNVSDFSSCSIIRLIVGLVYIRGVIWIMVFVIRKVLGIMWLLWLLNRYDGDNRFLVLVLLMRIKLF